MKLQTAVTLVLLIVGCCNAFQDCNKDYDCPSGEYCEDLLSLCQPCSCCCPYEIRDQIFIGKCESEMVRFAWCRKPPYGHECECYVAHSTSASTPWLPTTSSTPQRTSKLPTSEGSTTLNKPSTPHVTTTGKPVVTTIPGDNSTTGPDARSKSWIIVVAVGVCLVVVVGVAILIRCRRHLCKKRKMCDLSHEDGFHTLTEVISEQTETAIPSDVGSSVPGDGEVSRVGNCGDVASPPQDDAVPAPEIEDDVVAPAPEGGAVSPAPQGIAAVLAPEGGAAAPAPQYGAAVLAPQDGAVATAPQDDAVEDEYTSDEEDGDSDDQHLLKRISIKELEMKCQMTVSDMLENFDLMDILNYLDVPINGKCAADHLASKCAKLKRKKIAFINFHSSATEPATTEIFKIIKTKNPEFKCVKIIRLLHKLDRNDEVLEILKFHWNCEACQLYYKKVQKFHNR